MRPRGTKLKGDVIRQLRRARGWTQDDLATNATLTDKGAIYRAEKGMPKDMRDARLIAKALNVPVEEIIDNSQISDQPSLDQPSSPCLRQLRTDLPVKLEEMGIKDREGLASAKDNAAAAPIHTEVPPPALESPRPSTVAYAAVPPLMPLPPDVYAVPEYFINQFIGRVTELDRLDAWAKSQNTIMVIEEIGGQGKSALAWEWMDNRSPAAIPELAGRFWWSFSRVGVSMEDFVCHALAYVTGEKSPQEFGKTLSHFERGQRLLREVRRRPFLFVLDGFERLIPRCHPAGDEQTLDQNTCDLMTDGALLRELGRPPSKTKILVTTQSFPLELIQRASNSPIKGVDRLELPLLDPRDVCGFMSQAGVRGDKKTIRLFAEIIGHPLILEFVCGMITDYPGCDFDDWFAEQEKSGELNLSKLDLKQELYNRILHYAMRGLTDQARTVLSLIALLPENEGYRTLKVLHPLVSARPSDMEVEPFDLSKITRAESDQAQTELELARKELQRRKLLKYDSVSDRFGMHAVVRAYALGLIDKGARCATCEVLHDYFAKMPQDNLDSATELAHMTRSLKMYWYLIEAEKLDAAAQFYRHLSLTLVFHVGAYPTIVKMLKPLYRNNLQGMPFVNSPRDCSYIQTHFAIAHGGLGLYEEAFNLYVTNLKFDLENENWNKIVILLNNIAGTFNSLHQRSAEVAALSLARELAEAAENYDGVTSAILDQMVIAVQQGRFKRAKALDAEFVLRRQPPVRLYRPGTAEVWRCTRHFYQGNLTKTAWEAGYNLACQHRNINATFQFHALHALWDLCEGRPQSALDGKYGVKEAIEITERLGTPRPEYYDLLAWALALLGRKEDCRTALEKGDQSLFAAKTYLVLNEPTLTKKCALNAYHRAWGEGRPYIDWFSLERSTVILEQIGEQIPKLPDFHRSQVASVPCEKEVRRAIERLCSQRAGNTEDSQFHSNRTAILS